MGRLDGKVALISGGARGQGAAEAKLFAREGAHVVLGDVLDEEGRRVEAEIRTAGGDATYVHLDVTREDDWRAAVALAEHTYGRLNVLVNNAGIVIRKAIEETTEDDLERILAVNLKGVFWGTKHAIPAMRRAGGGSIINISSTAGLVGSPYGSASYTATKGWRASFDQGDRPAACHRPHPLQLCPSRSGRDGHAAGGSGRSDYPGGTAQACAAGPRWDGGRYRLRGVVSGLR